MYPPIASTLSTSLPLRSLVLYELCPSASVTVFLRPS